jgi:hypothetical protein
MSAYGKFNIGNPRLGNHELHPYSSDLDPTDFHVFGPHKEHQKWHKFDTNDEHKQGVLTWLNSQATSFYTAGITALS